MKDIEGARETIREVDRQMAVLFEQRMEAAREIAAWKKERGIPVQDEAQEERVIERNSSYIRDEMVLHYYLQFIRDTMALSRQYQERLISGARAVDSPPSKRSESGASGSGHGAGGPLIRP